MTSVSTAFEILHKTAIGHCKYFQYAYKAELIAARWLLSMR